MPRVARNRSRSETFRGTTTVRDSAGNIISGPSATSVTINSQIGDSKGRPVVPSALNHTKRNGVMRFSGKLLNDANGWMYEYDGIPAIAGSGADLPEKTLLPVKNGWLLDLIAGTNPSRPVFTPPQVLQDIITLPRLLMETGQLIRKPKKLMSAKEAANAHLAARFGWAPLIEDVGKLLKLQQTMIKRSKELKQLSSLGGLRRRLRFADTTATTRQVWRTALYGNGFIDIDVHTTVKKSQWGTIRWVPTAPPPYHPDDDSRNRYALKLIAGLTVEGMARGTWDVIPWTWLIGWFTNIGKYTLLHSNTVPATWAEACLMNRVMTTSFPGIVNVKGSKYWFIEPSGVYLHDIRTRITGGTVVLPGLNMPFMDMSRLSVLASLFVQRMR